MLSVLFCFRSAHVCMLVFHFLEHTHHYMIGEMEMHQLFIDCCYEHEFVQSYTNSSLSIMELYRDLMVNCYFMQEHICSK